MVKKIGALFLAVLLTCLAAAYSWGSEVTDQVSYGGTSLYAFLGNSISGLLEDFGDPTFDEYFEGSPCYGFDDEIYFGYDPDTGQVIHVFAEPSAVTVDGVTLDKDRDGLTELLGAPDDENPFYDEIDDEYKYILTYKGSNYTIDITLPSPGKKANNVSVYYLSGSIERAGQTQNSTPAIQSSGSKTTGGNSLPEGVFVMDGTVKENSVYGNVYWAPSQLMTRHFVKFVNIQNPAQVYMGCRIKILTPKNFLGDYETYVIDADGRPGGTVYNVVDAVVID